MKKYNHILAAVIALCLLLALSTGCASDKKEEQQTPAPQQESAEQPAQPEAAEQPDQNEEEQTPAVEKNGEVYILYTSDVHCGIDQGFGYVGLQQIRSTLEAQGYTTLLVDDGDSIQGEAIGTLTKGEAIIPLMNAVGYDVAIPGNHEFDYGVQRFLELTEMADFPYISCNLTYLGERIFEPYILKEIAGLKIAFVGVTTPTTVTSSTPHYFQNENGEYVYGFMQDETGETVYNAVQSAVDEARAEGAQLVYVMAHLGMNEADSPWTYADLLENTSGIDVLFDGHSHDSEQVVMKNKNGESVTRTACGTKLSSVGYSHISADGRILETGIWSWTSKTSAPELLGLQNELSGPVEDALQALEEMIGGVVAQSTADLTIFDPVERDNTGKPIRMVRRAETNLGDFCADVLRIETGADVGMIGGGSIRVDLPNGNMTYGDLLSVWPFQNTVCVIEVTGQQILDALEWGARSLPDENGGFLQVSGMSYEIYASIPSGCTVGSNGMMAGIEGERRVKNVTVGGVPLDPEKKYTVAGFDYTLLYHGDGFTAFDGASIVVENAGLDSQVLINFISVTLGGVIGDAYIDPYGQGRITIIG